jgi:hypothetical protein
MSNSAPADGGRSPRGRNRRHPSGLYPHVSRCAAGRSGARQTYHVERRYIELIRHEAETECMSITEVVNRAFRTYFEGK